MSGFQLSLREKILLTRLRIGESQAEFGVRFEVTDQTVRDWEAGTKPRGKSLNALTELFERYLTKVETPKTAVEQIMPPLQLDLPFGPLSLAIKPGPASAGSMRVEIRFESGVA
jgi:transcriptional regulator with XRE-family HTH domain